MLTRRSFLLGAIAAPAVVRAESLMRVKAILLPGDADYVTAAEVRDVYTGMVADGWHLTEEAARLYARNLADLLVNPPVVVRTDGSMTAWIRPGLPAQVLRSLALATAPAAPPPRPAS